jgi:Uma2 family endonuclease
MRGMPRQVAITVHDLEYMPEDGKTYEVIDGELFVSTSPTRFHQGSLGTLYFMVRTYLERNAIGEVYFGLGIVFDDVNGVIPDLVYYSNERKKTIATERLKGAPEIVVEALSPGTKNEFRDRVAKYKLYHENGVSEYWILDIEAKTIEIHRAGRTGGFETKAVLHVNDILTTPLLPGFECEVRTLFPKD